MGPCVVLENNGDGRHAIVFTLCGVCACMCVAPGIAQVSAEKGYRVLLKDRDLAGVARGQKYIDDNLKVRRPRTPTPQ